MSRAAVSNIPVGRRTPDWVPQPTVGDFFLILIGCVISLYLYQEAKLGVLPTADAPAWVTENVFWILPFWLILPPGIILLWPLFYALQRLRGRPQPLTSGEWLWGFAWLGTLLFLGWVFLKRGGNLPDFLKELTFQPEVVWYMIVV